MSEYTPGPWELCGEGTCCCLTISGKDHPIAKVTVGEWGDEFPNLRVEGPILARQAIPFIDRIAYGNVDRHTAQCNAHLIAAAPDLEKALSQLVRAIRYTSGVSLEFALKEADAAIAKATS